MVPARPHPPRSRDERGSAVVDFVLVSMLVVPLFLGILQVGLYLYVRNTLTAAASEGAVYAAVLNRQPGDGEGRTRDLIDGVVKDQLIDAVQSGETEIDGQPGVQVVVEAHMPPLGLWGPGIAFSVEGHAVKETGE
ncbi:pilus assembly protein [Kribbella capetownensis]|uniref:Pilus assembly protein n=1 Tax=Kribbella capetownensis TaxID=1572659 RepID=A0A4R0IKN0_9ACTN|nr:TadE family protein [Kribbella capetownensis]TCC33297.1 pilus assembly protein [Kribbella capetownensis]